MLQPSPVGDTAATPALGRGPVTAMPGAAIAPVDVPAVGRLPALRIPADRAFLVGVFPGNLARLKPSAGCSAAVPGVPETFSGAGASGE